MNQYLQRMKDAIKAYQSKAQEAQQKIERAKQLYQEKPAQEEAERIRAALDKDRQTAVAAIRAAKQEAAAGVKAWATKDGSKITDDSRLLAAGLINQKEYGEMVEKYADNYTMLDMLRQYGERRNKEAAEKAHGIPADPFPVSMIPTAEQKYTRWDNAEASAISLIDSLGRSGNPRDWTSSPAIVNASVENWANGVDM